MHIPCKYRFVGDSEELKKIASYMKNNPAKKFLSLGSTSCISEEVKVIPNVIKVKKEPVDDLDCVDGASSTSKPMQMDTQPRIGLPIADPTADAHRESKQNNDKTTFKPTVAVDIPVPYSTRNVRCECTREGIL